MIRPNDWCECHDPLLNLCKSHDCPWEGNREVNQARLNLPTPLWRKVER